MRIVRELSQEYPIAIFYYKKIYTILCHLKIYTLNIHSNKNDRILEIGKIIIEDSHRESHQKLLTLNTKIVVLYNFLKNIVGNGHFITLNQAFMGEFYQSLGIGGSNKPREIV